MLAGEQTSAKTLASSASDTISIAFTPQVGVDTVQVYGVVTYSADQNSDDNTTRTIAIPVTQPNLQTVTDLSATKEGSANKLAWTAIVPSKEDVTDDMETYPAFTLPGDGHYLEYEYNIGPWYNYDADQEYSLDLPGYSFPWEEEAFAFITFNPDSVKTEDSSTTPASSLAIFSPHSGSQFLAAFSMKSDMAIGTHVNDWLISPLLSGDQQTVSFWYKTLNKSNGTATFQVAYSTTDSLHDSFANVLVDSVTAQTDWTQVSVDLPAGAKYFAINHTTPVGINQILMIDDVTYTRGTGDVLGYKVYRDGEYVATVTSPEYTDAEGGEHQYNVTALYNAGESGLSNTASTSATAINSLKADTMSAINSPAYNLSGQRVGNAYRGVVVRNGKKYLKK